MSVCLSIPELCGKLLKGWPFFNVVFKHCVEKYFAHLAPLKYVQNNTVYRGDIPLQNNIVNYCKYTCSFPWWGFKVGKITTRLAAF